MVKDIMKDETFLARKSMPATKGDRQIGLDLLDTLKAHSHECVGMAANMIGYLKNIIVVHMDFMDMVMYNPKILSKKNEYEIQEGCLSLKGVRDTIRYDEITVEFQDNNFKKQTQVFTGFVAEIIQHECDHLEGIIIQIKLGTCQSLFIYNVIGLETCLGIRFFSLWEYKIQDIEPVSAPKFKGLLLTSAPILKRVLPTFAPNFKGVLA